MNDLPFSLTLEELFVRTQHRRNVIEDICVQHQTSDLFSFKTNILAGLYAEFGNTIKVYFSPWRSEVRSTFNDVWYADTKFRQTTVKVRINNRVLVELTSTFELEWDCARYTFEDVTNAWSIGDMSFKLDKAAFVKEPSPLLAESGLALTVNADREKFLHELRKQFTYLVETLVKDELYDELC